MLGWENVLCIFYLNILKWIVSHFISAVLSYNKSNPYHCLWPDLCSDYVNHHARSFLPLLVFSCTNNNLSTWQKKDKDDLQVQVSMVFTLLESQTPISGFLSKCPLSMPPEMSSGTPGCLVSTRLTSCHGEQWVARVYTFVCVGVCIEFSDPCGKGGRRSFWPEGLGGQGLVSNKIFSNVTTPFSRGLSVHTACTQHARVYLVPGNKWWNLNPFEDPFLLSLQNWSRFQTRSRNHKPCISVLLWIMKLPHYQFCPLLNGVLKSYQWRSPSPEWPLLPLVTLYQSLPLYHNSQLCLLVVLCWKVSSCSSSYSCTPQPIHLLPQGQVSETLWMSPTEDRPIDTSVWSWKQISVLLLK